MGGELGISYLQRVLVCIIILILIRCHLMVLRSFFIIRATNFRPRCNSKYQCFCFYRTVCSRSQTTYNCDKADLPTEEGKLELIDRGVKYGRWDSGTLHLGVRPTVEIEGPCWNSYFNISLFHILNGLGTRGGLCWGLPWQKHFMKLCQLYKRYHRSRSEVSSGFFLKKIIFYSLSQLGS
jgi:hypothetical protein